MCQLYSWNIIWLYFNISKSNLKSLIIVESLSPNRTFLKKKKKNNELTISVHKNTDFIFHFIYRLADTEQQYDSVQQALSQLTQTLAEEKRRREAAEEALGLSEELSNR